MDSYFYIQVSYTMGTSDKSVLNGCKFYTKTKDELRILADFINENSKDFGVLTMYEVIDNKSKQIDSRTRLFG